MTFQKVRGIAKRIARRPPGGMGPRIDPVPSPVYEETMTLAPDYPRTTDMDLMAARGRPGTLAFYRYWDGKRAGRQMPSRRDIDPVEMRRWLANMQLVDVHHNPRRLVYRLVGEADVNFRGYNPTGRTVEECGIGANIAETLRNYDIVITERRPVFDWSDYVSKSGFLRSQECILLPLSDDDDIVNMVATYAEVDVKD